MYAFLNITIDARSDEVFAILGVVIVKRPGEQDTLYQVCETNVQRYSLGGCLYDQDRPNLVAFKVNGLR